MAALMAVRWCEAMWERPAMICYYMTERYDHELSKPGAEKNPALWVSALENGIDESNPVDFVICSEDGTLANEFQLKRFGLREDSTQDTDALISYLIELKHKYARTEACCLVAVVRMDLIDFPKVRAAMVDQNFPFERLIIFGLVDKEYIVAQILPDEGWSALPLWYVVSD
jgi:hypothetical protein